MFDYSMSVIRSEAFQWSSEKSEAIIRLFFRNLDVDGERANFQGDHHIYCAVLLAAGMTKTVPTQEVNMGT